MILTNAIINVVNKKTKFSVRVEGLCLPGISERGREIQFCLRGSTSGSGTAQRKCQVKAEIGEPLSFLFKKPQSCYTEQFDFPVDTMYIKFNTASNAYIHVHFIDLGCLTGIKCVLWILDLLLFKLFC